MHLQIDSKSGIPIYLQLIEQIKHLVASGKLNEGEQLPTVRQLAVDLEINPNTVAKSYAELERQGIIERRQGIGTFVRLRRQALTAEERSEKLTTLCANFLAQVHQYGFEPQEAVKVLRDLIKGK
jgi:GntR family transcriptional regulator